MKIHIIRHADPDYEHDALTQHGQLEALALAKSLVTLPIEKIYASVMGRATQTAQFTAGLMQLPIRPVSWARELEEMTVPNTYHVPMEHAGSLALWNVPAPLLQQAAATEGDNWLNAFSAALPAAKTRSKEVENGLAALLKENNIISNSGRYCKIAPLPQKDIALFCHLGLGLFLLSDLLCIPVPLVWQAFWLAPSSHTTLLVEERGSAVSFRALCVGDTSHLLSTALPANTRGLLYNTK